MFSLLTAVHSRKQILSGSVGEGNCQNEQMLTEIRRAAAGIMTSKQVPRHTAGDLTVSQLAGSSVVL
jgi:hypothetical protein